MKTRQELVQDCKDAYDARVLACIGSSNKPVDCDYALDNGAAIWESTWNAHCNAVAALAEHDRVIHRDNVNI